MIICIPFTKLYPVSLIFDQIYMYIIYSNESNLFEFCFAIADEADTPFKVPEDMNCLTYLLKYPITLILWISTPDCRKHSKLTMVTFFVCIAWIGIASYAVAMLITIVGTYTVYINIVYDCTRY